MADGVSKIEQHYSQSHPDVVRPYGSHVAKRVKNQGWACRLCGTSNCQESVHKQHCSVLRQGILRPVVVEDTTSHGYLAVPLLLTVKITPNPNT